jgi:hypothetical protein
VAALTRHRRCCAQPKKNMRVAHEQLTGKIGTPQPCESAALPPWPRSTPALSLLLLPRLLLRQQLLLLTWRVVPQPKEKATKKYPVGPWVLGLFLFVVVGSGAPLSPPPSTDCTHSRARADWAPAVRSAVPDHPDGLRRPLKRWPLAQWSHARNTPGAHRVRNALGLLSALAAAHAMPCTAAAARKEEG